MKNKILIMSASVLVLLTSCYSTQTMRSSDDLYGDKQPVKIVYVERAAEPKVQQQQVIQNKTHTNAVDVTSSEYYPGMFTQQLDEDQSSEYRSSSNSNDNSRNSSNTTVNITLSPSWYGAGWSIGYSPSWYYSSFVSPWYSPWYDPWYYRPYAWGGWYSPWNSPWYNPWYNPWHNPWHNHWHGGYGSHYGYSKYNDRNTTWGGRRSGTMGSNYTNDRRSSTSSGVNRYNSDDRRSSMGGRTGTGSTRTSVFDNGRSQETRQSGVNINSTERPSTRVESPNRSTSTRTESTTRNNSFNNSNSNSGGSSVRSSGSSFNSGSSSRSGGSFGGGSGSGGGSVRSGGSGGRR